MGDPSEYGAYSRYSMLDLAASTADTYRSLRGGITSKYEFRSYSYVSDCLCHVYRYSIRLRMGYVRMGQPCDRIYKRPTHEQKKEKQGNCEALTFSQEKSTFRKEKQTLKDSHTNTEVLTDDIWK